MESSPRGIIPETPDEGEQFRLSAGEPGSPIEQEFPPTETSMLDDDFFNAYGREPDE